MVDVRQFIRSLGKNAPEFFGASDQTIRRWLKTGSVPIKAAQKVFTAVQAGQAAQGPTQQAPEPQAQPQIDPLTHMPSGLVNRTPQYPSGGRAQAAGGTSPDWIEMNPVEQNFGNNFTRPGRMSVAPMRPMKLRDEGGQKVAYVDTEPKAPTVLPPSIPKGEWVGKGEPLPAPRKTEGVPQK
jgi:hypothetical protein